MTETNSSTYKYSTEGPWHTFSSFYKRSYWVSYNITEEKRRRDNRIYNGMKVREVLTNDSVGEIENVYK